MMIEPPRHLRRSRVFEIDNRILTIHKRTLIEQRPRPMHQPVIRELIRRLHALPVKSSEQRSRASPIETFIVIKNPAFQSQPPSMSSTLLAIAKLPA